MPAMGVENESEITRLSEVEKALREKKTGKALGVDGVTCRDVEGRRCNCCGVAGEIV